MGGRNGSFPQDRFRLDLRCKSPSARRRQVATQVLYIQAYTPPLPHRCLTFPHGNRAVQPSMPSGGIQRTDGRRRRPGLCDRWRRCNALHGYLRLFHQFANAPEAMNWQTGTRRSQARTGRKWNGLCAWAARLIWKKAPITRPHAHQYMMAVRSNGPGRVAKTSATTEPTMMGDTTAQAPFPIQPLATPLKSKWTGTSCGSFRKARMRAPR